VSTVDVDHLRQWVGHETLASDTLSLSHARLMAATLGLPQNALQAGTALPPLWHWIYFLEGLPPNELRRDGHPARGGFLPPVPLANRMWAGGTVVFHADLPLGAEVQKRSRIEAVEHKQGRSGELVFVTVLHEVLRQGRVALSETHDIVYKGVTTGRAAAPPPLLCQWLDIASPSPPRQPPCFGTRRSRSTVTGFTTMRTTAAMLRATPIL
jgi:3-methylfumaryl-CoA hydratase